MYIDMAGFMSKIKRVHDDQMTRNLRLWMIPYVNGDDIGDVEEPELVEMESTFTEMLLWRGLIKMRS
jgi:hypothetical protein